MRRASTPEYPAGRARRWASRRPPTYSSRQRLDRGGEIASQALVERGRRRRQLCPAREEFGEFLVWSRSTRPAHARRKALDLKLAAPVVVIARRIKTGEYLESNQHFAQGAFIRFGGSSRRIGTMSHRGFEPSREGGRCDLGPRRGIPRRAQAFFRFGRVLGRAAQGVARRAKLSYGARRVARSCRMPASRNEPCAERKRRCSRSSRTRSAVPLALDARDGGARRPDIRFG